jgi:hypothetical protein
MTTHFAVRNLGDLNKKNMKRTLYKIGVVFLVILLPFSCSEDLLEPKPLSFFTPENVFEDESGYHAALVTMRKALVTPITGSNRYQMISEWGHSEAGLPAFLFDLNQLTPFGESRYEYVDFFSELYEFIKDANVVINRIDDIEWEDEQEKNTVLAEALWHRAYWYYIMVNNYGDVPFVSQEVSSAKLDYQTNTRKSINLKLQTDLEFAVQHLPESAVPGAVSRGAGNHLLTKIYLSNLEFDQAITAASRVIDGPYALMNQRFGQDAGDPKRNVIWDLHRPDNRNLSLNTENILSIVDRFEAPAGAQTDNGSYTMRHYNASWWHAKVKDSEGAHGTMDAGPMYDSLGRGNPDIVLSPYIFYDIWNQHGFSWGNTPDLRRADINWVDKHELVYNNPESVDYLEPIDPKNIVPMSDSLSLVYPFPHFKTWMPQHDPNARPMGGHGDQYVFRLAETYLLRAEAHFWKGDLQLAANDINEVRARANAPLVDAADVNIEYIFDERARELFIEAPRHAEMVRASYIIAELGRNGYDLANFSQNNWWYDRMINHNKFIQMQANKSGMVAQVSPFHVLWPIDNNMINANTGAQINQNIGYFGAENNVAPLETVDETLQ